MTRDKSIGSYNEKRIRVLYSFPHKIGEARICHTAWQQVAGLAAAGASVTAYPGHVHKALPSPVSVFPTLARGSLRIPYKLLGSMYTFALHDRIVARRIQKIADQIDIIHTWPLAALETLRAARKLGIPTVLERPNAHTRFAYEVVENECRRLGVSLPPDHEHAYKPDVLRKEEEEYHLADRLLCPSDFTLRTFTERGFSAGLLARHIYGYDETMYHPMERPRSTDRGLSMLFVGVCAVRKGLHFALDAWLRSPARHNGTFSIAGEFLPAYREKLSGKLTHPSIRILGHRNDVPELMRRSDILVLPSIEEGSPLSVSEAIGSGCVPLVSEACTGNCTHLQNALVHPIGDVETLTEHITLLHENRSLLERLRVAAISSAPQITWTAAGQKLLGVYREILASTHRVPSAIPVPCSTTDQVSLI